MLSIIGYGLILIFVGIVGILLSVFGTIIGYIILFWVVLGAIKLLGGY